MNILNLLCDLTAPKFLGPYGLDIAGSYPMWWDEDAHWASPSKLHVWLVSLKTPKKS